MSKIRTLFLGTPLFSAKILEGIKHNNHLNIVGIVTQPDRPRGRNLKTSPAPVKEWAIQNNIPYITPQNVNEEESLVWIQNQKAEIAIVVAYGQILSENLLTLFPYGAVNIHASLLPLWRGAAPIQRALAAGDSLTGVTLQKIVSQLDAGDIIGVRKIPLDENINAFEVLEACIPLSIDLLTMDLIDYVRGHLIPQSQDHRKATYAYKITTSECLIDWEEPALSIHNKIRGFIMGPGAFTYCLGKRVKLIQTHLVKNTPQVTFSFAKIKASRESTILNDNSWGPGCIFKYNDQILIQCGYHTFLQLINLQPEGKTVLNALEWWNQFNQNKRVL